MSRPLTPTSIRTVFTGRIISVHIESIVLPGGHRLDAEIVRHPGSVVIAPVTGAGEILLVRQYRHAIGRATWELPAGTLKPGEDRQAAALRECHEEIGLVAGRLEPLGSFFPTPGFCDEEMHLYRATELRTPGASDAAAHQDEDEDIQVEAFTPERLRALLAAGDLIDLKTVAAMGLMGLLSDR